MAGKLQSGLYRTFNEKSNPDELIAMCRKLSESLAEDVAEKGLKVIIGAFASYISVHALVPFGGREVQL